MCTHIHTHMRTHTHTRTRTRMAEQGPPEEKREQALQQIEKKKRVGANWKKEPFTTITKPFTTITMSAREL